MECTKLKNWNVYQKKEKYYQGWTWTMDTQVTNIPCMLAFLTKFIFKRGASYWINGNNLLPEKNSYNTQCQYDPIIQNFMWGNSPELKS